MSAEQKPGLELVEPASEASSGASPEQASGVEKAPAPGEPRETASSRIAMLLAVVVAVLGLLLAFQYQTARGLEARVQGLEAELAGARAEIAAHERKMEAVRSHVADVADRMGVLQRLVAEPATPTAR